VVEFEFDLDLLHLFCPNSIQLDAGSSGACFTTHRRHFGVFIFRTKAPVIVIGLGWCLDWLGLLGLFAGGFDMDWIVIQFFC
jgi:hypothetical protein